MNIETVSARLLAAAIRECRALDTMRAIKKETAVECERRKDDDYPGESDRCEHARGVGPDYEPFGSLNEDKWCARCKLFAANRPRFNAAKRELFAARRQMMTAWKAGGGE